jgi:hypothetical protein
MNHLEVVGKTYFQKMVEHIFHGFLSEVANGRLPRKEGAGIKPANATKGLPSQFSPSRERGSPNDQLIDSGV